MAVVNSEASEFKISLFDIVIEDEGYEVVEETTAVRTAYVSIKVD